MFKLEAVDENPSLRSPDDQPLDEWDSASTTPDIHSVLSVWDSRDSNHGRESALSPAAKVVRASEVSQPSGSRPASPARLLGTMPPPPPPQLAPPEAAQPPAAAAAPSPLSGSGLSSFLKGVLRRRA